VGRDSEAASAGARFSNSERFRAGLLTSFKSRDFHELEFMGEELNRLKLFSGFDISLRERVQICQYATLLTAPPGTKLFCQSDRGDFFYVVLIGRVGVLEEDQTLTQRVLD
jgi:CRP-like cAMP-binding protein